MVTYNAIMEQKLLGVNAGYFADGTDADVAMVIRYTGDQADADVAVSSTPRDLEFKHGAASSTAADATIKIGSTPGTIDVSESDADTFGKVVDHINESPNWEARLIGARRADDPDEDTGSLKNLSADDGVLTRGGLALKFDTGKFDKVSVAVAAHSLEANKGAAGGWLPDCYLNRCRSDIALISHSSTYGSGTNVIEVWDVDTINNRDHLMMKYNCEATTQEGVKDFIGAELESVAPGHYLIVRINASAEHTAGYLGVVGRVWQFV